MAGFIFLHQGFNTKKSWTSAVYSDKQTLNTLVAALPKEFSLGYLETKNDVDELEDLKELFQKIKNSESPVLNKILNLEDIMVALSFLLKLHKLNPMVNYTYNLLIRTIYEAFQTTCNYLYLFTNFN